MKLTESQLRNIIKKTITEAISQNDYQNATRFMNANYSRDHKTPADLFDIIKQAVVKKQGKDIEGNLDIVNSANQIYPLIQMFNAEIQKLNRVYKFFYGTLNGTLVRKDKSQRTPMDPARKQKMLASRAANKQERERIMAQYGNLDPSYAYTNKQGGIDSTLAQKGLNNMRNNRVNPNRLAGSGWFGQGLNEEIEEGLFNRNKNSYDEVDNAVLNYRKFTPEQMKAILPKIQERIQDYQRIVNDLQGKLNQWTGADGSNAMIYDRNAQARAERDAALKAVGRKNVMRQAVNETIDRVVSDVIRKIKG